MRTGSARVWRSLVDRLAPGARPAPAARGHGPSGGRGGGRPLRRAGGGRLRQPHRGGERRGVRLATGPGHRAPRVRDPRRAPRCPLAQAHWHPEYLVIGVPLALARAGAHPAHPGWRRAGRRAQAAPGAGAAGPRRAGALLPAGGDGRGQRRLRPRRRPPRRAAHASGLGAGAGPGGRWRAGGPVARGSPRDARPRRSRGGGGGAAEPRGAHRPARSAQAARLGAHHRHRRVGGTRGPHRLRGRGVRQRGGTHARLHPAGAIGAARRRCGRGHRRLVQHAHRRARSSPWRSSSASSSCRCSAPSSWPASPPPWSPAG